MSDLKEAIERFRSANEAIKAAFPIDEGSDFEQVLTAAERWAALRWRPGTERPDAPGFYVCIVNDTIVVYRFTSAGWLDVSGGFVRETKTPDWYLDGALPEVPSGTDQEMSGKG